MLARTEEIQKQIQHLSGRDLQLWSIGILVILVLTSGLLALILPNMVWTQRVMHVEHSYLPQLFFGLISLILLFNIYLLAQKRNLNTTRLALIRELVLNERLESLSLIDPLTQFLNRRALNELVPREVARANRLGSSLTFMAIDLNGFSGISSKFGALEGDRVLIEFAKILKTVFRGADLPFVRAVTSFSSCCLTRPKNRLIARPSAAQGSGSLESGQQEGLRILVQLGPGAVRHGLRCRRCSARRRPQDVLQEAQAHASILKILKRLHQAGIVSGSSVGAEHS